MQYNQKTNYLCNSCITHPSQVAYTASSSLFGIDKERYPRFYRLVPITEQLADGYVALVKKLNWNRVAVISYDDELSLNVC